MTPSTILHPALLGHGRRFARELAAMAAQVRWPGLFDLPVDADGLHGHTQTERQAVRAFQMLGEAFGLHGDALLEWHRVFARDELPPRDGALLRGDRDVLADLLLRARTLAQYQDRDGRAADVMRIWQRARPLRQLIEAGARLHAELRMYAPHLAAWAPLVQDQLATLPMGGLRDLKRELMATGLSAAGWRWLVGNTPPEVLHARPSLEGFSRLVLLANAYGAVGPAFVPDELFNAYAMDLVAEAAELEATVEDKPWLLEAAWRQCELMDDRGDREFFLLGSFMRVARWVVDDEWAPDANQRRAGWPAIERARRRAMGADCGRMETWPVPFESLERGALFAYAIPNSMALCAEGEAMGHCIADYTAQAVAGAFLPFSVRGPGGERVATFSLVRDVVKGGAWVLDACKGRFNQDVEAQQVHRLVEAVRLAVGIWSG